MNRRFSRRMHGLMVLAFAAVISCSRANLTELQKIRSGMLDVVLLSPHEGLRHGKDAFVVEFRSVAGGTLVDVGTVRGSANMPMAGTPMFGTVDVQRTDVPGRYAANGEFSMAGTWRMTLQWDGPAGQGSVTFPGTVQ
jgi:hypothetical protein